MAVAKTLYTDPFSQDGLGQASGLGVGYLKKVRVTLTSPDTVATINASDLGAAKIYGVVSIVPRTAGLVYVSAQTDTSVSLTAENNTDVFDVYLLVAGT